MPRSSGASLALILGALAPLPLAAQRAPLGPLTAEEGAPLQRLGFTATVEGAGVTPVGKTRTDLWLGYANVWEQDSSAVANVFLDVERLVTAATLRVGVAPQVEVGVRATLERTGGGFLDRVVLGLHEVLGAGDRNRRDYPRDAYGQWLRDGDGTLLVDIPRRAAPTLGDVRAFAKWGAYASADGRRALAVKAEARFPTAHNVVGAERSDAALLLMGHAEWRSWYLHALAGGTTVRRSPGLRGVLRDRQWLGMLGLERPVRQGLSLMAQLTGSTQLVRDFGDHDVDGAPTNAVFGLVGRTDGGWRWEVAMQEDVPARGPSTDFTLQLALGRTW